MGNDGPHPTIFKYAKDKHTPKLMPPSVNKRKEPATASTPPAASRQRLVPSGDATPFNPSDGLTFVQDVSERESALHTEFVGGNGTYDAASAGHLADTIGGLEGADGEVAAGAALSSGVDASGNALPHVSDKSPAAGGRGKGGKGGKGGAGPSGAGPS